MTEISLELIPGALHGAGAVAFYFAAIDVVKERRGRVVVKDKLIIAFVSPLWPCLILYQLFYRLLATIIKEGDKT